MRVLGPEGREGGRQVAAARGAAEAAGRHGPTQVFMTPAHDGCEAYLVRGAVTSISLGVAGGGQHELNTGSHCRHEACCSSQPLRHLQTLSFH